VNRFQIKAEMGNKNSFERKKRKVIDFKINAKYD
jgi:hypothetical protein